MNDRILRAERELAALVAEESRRHMNGEPMANLLPALKAAQEELRRQNVLALRRDRAAPATKGKIARGEEHRAYAVELYRQGDSHRLIARKVADRFKGPSADAYSDRQVDRWLAEEKRTHPRNV